MPPRISGMEWWNEMGEWNTGMAFDPQNSVQSPLK